MNRRFNSPPKNFCRRFPHPINPSTRDKIGDLHRCEPDVFAQLIAGQDAPTHGEAHKSWLTDLAA